MNESELVRIYDNWNDWKTYHLCRNCFSKWFLIWSENKLDNNLEKNVVHKTFLKFLKRKGEKVKFVFR
jgi:hypothetical protein